MLTKILVVLGITWISFPVATGVSINISASIGDTVEFKWNKSGTFVKGELFVIPSHNVTWIVPGSTSCNSLKENNGKPINVVAMINGTQNVHNQVNPGESGLNATVNFTGNLAMGRAWWKIHVKGDKQSYTNFVFVPCLRVKGEVLAYAVGLGRINLKGNKTPLGPVLNPTTQVPTTRKATTPKATTHGHDPKSPNKTNKNGLNAGKITAIAIFGSILFLVLVVIVFCVWKHKCRQTKKAKEDVETTQ